MKSLVTAVAVLVVLAAPAASFAQSEQPLTRAEVQAQLKQIEQAGYQPGKSTDSSYPADIQAAEARVAAQNATAQADTTGYGTTATGSSQAGGNAAGVNPGQ
jgi:opacity protein-like surface antigen